MLTVWPGALPPEPPRGHGPLRFDHYSCLVCECGWRSQILPCVDRSEAQRQEWIAHAAECCPPVKKKG